MKKIFTNALFCSLIIIGVSNSTKAQSVVNINPTIEYQTIEGWGVSLAWWAHLAGGMSDVKIEELANYAVTELNFNIFRFNIAGGENPNCTEGNHFRKDGALIPGYRDPQNNNEGWGTFDLSKDFRQIKMMNAIAELRASKGDIITETISYSPPWWMTHGECSAGNVSSTSENLKSEFRDDFADYLVSVSKGLNDKYPLWNIEYLEAFNEPISGYWQKGGNQEGSQIYPSTQANILWRMWQRKNALGFSELKFTAADNSQVTTSLNNMESIATNNPGEYNGIAKISTHSYGGNWQDKAALAEFAKENGDKKIWQTETGPLGWNAANSNIDRWRRHYDIAYRLIEDMRNLKATVWCDWQLMSIDEGWGMLHQTNWNPNNPYQNANVVKTRGFYCRKNVTNFIKVGYKIIHTNDGTTLAATSPDGNETVLVIVNHTANQKNYNINLNSLPTISSFTTYRTSGGTSDVNENTSQKTNQNINEKGVLVGNVVNYNAPPYSVTTMVFNTNNALSTNIFNVDEFTIYPQPFTKTCTFDFPRKLENANIIIYDVVGKEVKRVENINKKSIEIDRKNLNNGIYIYKILENNKTITSGKLLIK